MARTIGSKYKNVVIKLASDARKLGLTAFGISNYITTNMPVEAYETWEMATQEIERLADDEAFKQEVK